MSKVGKNVKQRLINNSWLFIYNAKLNQKRIVSISIGESESVYFNKMMRKYSDIKTINLPKGASNEKLNSINDYLELVKRQREQSTNVKMEYVPTPVYRKIIGDGNSAIFVDEGKIGAL